VVVRCVREQEEYEDEYRGEGGEGFQMRIFVLPIISGSVSVGQQPQILRLAHRV
jgi:hypothetical protein